MNAFSRSSFIQAMCLHFVLGAGCSSQPVVSAPSAEHEAFLARASRATSLEERWSLGVEARLKVGLGFGYVAALRENGHTVTRAAGKRTLEPITSIGERDLLEIGSVTKSFTGILLHLAEIEGKLRLDQKLSEIFDELKTAPAGDITVKELGLHRSGLAREPKGLTVPDPTNPRRGLNRVELIAALAKADRSPIPEGATERSRVYSNWGYMTLGLLLEKVYHRDFKELVEHRILFPLGMSESGVDRKTRKRGKWIPKAVPGFSLASDSLPLRDYDSFAAAAGGIESNAQEMGKFLAALERPPSGKLGRAMLAAMDSGIGWDSEPGIPVLRKNGATTAHNAILFFDRGTKRGLFVGSNTDARPDEFGEYVFGSLPSDALLELAQPRRIVPSEELVNGTGVFRVARPEKDQFAGLRSVELLETLGRRVGRFDFGSIRVGALMVPAEKAGLWTIIDGWENRDRLKVFEGSIELWSRSADGRSESLELEKNSKAPELYPAFEK